MVAWVFAVTIEGGDLACYLLPSPLILVVGGSLAGLLIAYDNLDHMAQDAENGKEARDSLGQ